jgi:hypothetical protein
MQLNQILNEVRVGDPVTAGNLQVFPLLRDTQEETDYTPIDELLAGGEAEISEVTAGGSVPTAKVINRSAHDALILDGMELRGAKQNRMIDVTIIIEKHSEAVIPVTCVEQGRWSYRTKNFAASERTVPSRLRAMKSRQYAEDMSRDGHAKVSQGAVWDEVSRYLERSGASSDTWAMDDVFTQRSADVETIAAGLRDIQADGAVVALNGEIVGMDLVADRRIFRKLWTALLRGYALDAILEPAKASPPLSREAVAAWIEAVGTGAQVSTHAVPGSGQYHAVVSPSVVGGAVTHRDHTVHVGLAPRV